MALTEIIHLKIEMKPGRSQLENKMILKWILKYQEHTNSSFRMRRKHSVDKGMRVLRRHAFNASDENEVIGICAHNEW